MSIALANDYCENVASREYEKVFSAVLHLGSAVLGVDDLVTDCDVERHAVSVVIDATGTYGDYFALLGLLFRSVRNNEPRRGGLFCVNLLDNNAILERLNGHRHV